MPDNKYCNLVGTNPISTEYTKINDGFAEVEADKNALDNRIDLIITTPAEGISSQEIIDARGGEVVLGNRLNNIEIEKATITYVDAKTAALASGSPKGTYATLVALQAAFPTGTTGIYVVLADGHWYYWNGAAWTDGGAYQSSGIADESITPVMTNSEIPNTKNTHNLYDKSNAVPGFFVANSTGIVTANASFAYFEIAVKAGQFIYIKCPTALNNNYGCFFTAADVFVANVNANITINSAKTKAYIKVPATAEKMKFSFLATQIDVLHFYQDISKIHDGVNINPDWNDEIVLSRSNSPFVSNLIDTWRSDYWLVDWDSIISITGAPSYNTLLSMTVPFHVLEGEKYVVENYVDITHQPSYVGARGVYLDADFVFLSALPITNSRSPEYTVPADAKYALIIFERSLSAVVSIKRTYTPTIDVKIRKDVIYPAINESAVAFSNDWAGLAWVALGDSITANELWQPHIMTVLGLVHTNCGGSGTYLAGNSATAFWQDVRLNAVKTANPDVITILGGANDMYNGILLGDATEFPKTLANKDKTNFYGAYSYIIENLLAWKPTVRIFILTTTWAWDNFAHGVTGLTYKDFANACIAIAQYYGLPCVDLMGEMGLNAKTKTTFLSDEIHPNAVGAKRLAEVTIGKLKSINPL